MPHWNPTLPPKCISCGSHLDLLLKEFNSNYDGEYGECVLWCRFCGTVLKANSFDPISQTDWKIPDMLEIKRF
jgi:transcription initiation factor TFIIIB Brf1 subunit/transcription initiation factor TFIIB